MGVIVGLLVSLAISLVPSGKKIVITNSDTPTCGIQEAINSQSSNAVIEVPTGCVLHAPIATRANYVTILDCGGTEVNTIQVGTDFPLTATGVITFSPSNLPLFIMGGEVKDCTISFTQPDSTNFALYTHWPPAIVNQLSSAYMKVDGVEIINGWDGITNVSGNNGMRVLHTKMSTYHRGIQIDKSYDTNRLEDVSVQPIGLTMNQLNTMLNKANGSLGLYVGRADDLTINDVMIGVDCADFHTGVGDYFGSAANITNLWCDSGNFNVSDGIISVANGNFDTGSAIPAISVTGGGLSVTNSKISSLFPYPLVNFAPSHGFANEIHAYLDISDTMFLSGNVDIPSVVCSTTSWLMENADCRITGNHFERVKNLTYLQPTIKVFNGKSTGKVVAVVTGNWNNDIGTGSGYFVGINTDEYHVIKDNSLNGWLRAYPATQQKLDTDTTQQVSLSSGIPATWSITPTGPLFHITSVGTIESITVVNGFPYKTFTVIADSGFATALGGNITRATSLAAGESGSFSYDPVAGMWSPSF